MFEMFEIKPFIVGGLRKAGFASLFFIIRRGTWHLENGVWLLAWRRGAKRVRKLFGGNQINHELQEAIPHVADDLPAELLEEMGPEQLKRLQLADQHHSVISARIKADALVQAAQIAARSAQNLSLAILLLSALILTLIITLLKQRGEACSHTR